MEALHSGLQEALPESPFRPAGGSPRIRGLVKRWSRDYRSGIEHYALHPAAGAKGSPVAWSSDGGMEVTEHRIWLHGLPLGLRGFRIVHLTDIHHGLFVPLHVVTEAVELANQLE